MTTDDERIIASRFAEVEAEREAALVMAKETGVDAQFVEMAAVEMEVERGIVGLRPHQLPESRRSVAALVEAQMRSELTMFADCRTSPAVYRELLRYARGSSNVTMHLKYSMVSVMLHPVPTPPPMPPPGPN